MFLCCTLAYHSLRNQRSASESKFSDLALCFQFVRRENDEICGKSESGPILQMICQGL